MEIALINEDLFKMYSPVREDTIITEFVPYILMAQKMYIKPVLGIPLYEELQTQIKAASVTPAPDPNPITPENRALLVEIAPALSHYAVYQGLPFQWASIVNKGVTIRDSENSKAVDIKDVSQLRRWLKDDAERLVRDLIGYMRNCALYPLWKPADGCGCEDGTDGRNRVPLDAGIYIPKRRR